MEAFNYLYSSLPLLLFLLYIIRYNSSSSSRIGFVDFFKNRHRFLDWSTELLLASPTSTLAMSRGLILTADPAIVEHVLKTNFHNYLKGPQSHDHMEDLLGHGIFNSDEEQWRVQRKIAAVEFNSHSFRAFVMDTVRAQVLGRLLPLLSSRVDDESATIDLQETLDRFAFDNVCKITFDFDPCRLAHEGTSEGDAFASSYGQVATVIMKRFSRPRLLWSLTRFLGIGIEGQAKRNVAILNDFATKIVRERKARRDGEVGSDLLSRYMEAGDFPDGFLQDVVLNYVLAGRDTTSSVMSWFFWLVSSRSRIENEILNEIKTVRAKHGSSTAEAFTLDELREMNYLHAAISESMRLYPPVPLEWRISKGDDVLPDGTKVARGVKVLHSPYAMGRIESIWGESRNEFRPERWLEKGIFQPRNPYQYPVFHGGPRMCLGKEMAYIQMKVVIASVMEKFVIRVVEEGEPEKELDVVLRMKKGLPVTIRARRDEEEPE